MSVYGNNGARWHDVELRNPRTGAAIVALDIDGIVAAFVPSVGDQTPTMLVTTLDYGRNVTASITDANTSMGAIEIYVPGYDMHGRRLTETLTWTAGAGSGTAVGTKMFYTIDSNGIEVHVNPTITAVVDAISVGWGTRIQLPYDVADAAEVTQRRIDAVSGGGTIDAINNAWVLSGGDVPDGVKQFFCSGRSTA